MDWLVRAAADPVMAQSLRDAGWTPSFRYDLTRWRAWMRDEGWHVNDVAETVLSSLGGLTITPVRTAESVFSSGLLTVDPEYAATGESDRLHSREQEVGVALCPVAEWAPEFTVLVGEDGRVFAETTFSVLLLGDSPITALQTIIKADRRPRVIIGPQGSPAT